MDTPEPKSPLTEPEAGSPLAGDGAAGNGAGTAELDAENPEELLQRPVAFTEAAVRKVVEFAENHEAAQGKHLRMFVQGVQGRKGPDFEYGFTFDDPMDADERLDQGEITVLVDSFSFEYVKGLEVDFVDDLEGSGFVVNDLRDKFKWRDNPIAAKVQQVIDEQINPGVATHGGVVELLDVVDGTVYVKMGGGCQGCGMADVTLKQGIERILKERVPEVEEILDTTDHAAGDNPFFQPSKGMGGGGFR